MKLGGSNTAPEGRAYGDLRPVAPATAVAIPAELWPDLVESLVCETEELDLRHREQARDGQTQSRAHDRPLCEGCVDDTVGTKPL